jgi:hypothetical protein
MPPPTPKESWLIDFARVLTDARPELGQKFADLIAIRAWATYKGMPAKEAALQWIEQSKNSSGDTP